MKISLGISESDLSLCIHDMNERFQGKIFTFPNKANLNGSVGCEEIAEILQKHTNECVRTCQVEYNGENVMYSTLAEKVEKRRTFYIDERWKGVIVQEHRVSLH